MARMRRIVASFSAALAAIVAIGTTVLLTAAGPAGAFSPGEGTGRAWCRDHGGLSLGSYHGVFACKPDRKNSGKTPFDSYAGFQPTELANRFLYLVTGHTLFVNEVGGNYVALASATFAIPDAASGTPGILPAAGDIISMWGGRSRQKQNGDATMVAIVTKVAATSSGWTITTLNQGDESRYAYNGFNTIAVSRNGLAWGTENGYYTEFDWLRLVAGGPRPDADGWTAAEAPQSAGSHASQLLSVACSSAASCTAVGVSDRAALLIFSTGQRWTQADVPVPASPPSTARLVTVACPTSSVCVAAGRYTSSGQQQGLLLSGHGRAWTATTAPLPGNAAADPHASVLSVACPAASACVAVGQYAGLASSYPLLLVGHGSSWLGLRAPVPADAASPPAAQLVSIACPSAGHCTAVGSYRDSLGNRQGMLVTGHGAVWTAIRSPLPGVATVPGALLSAVACPQVTACVAVGGYDGDSRGLVVRGGATLWTAIQAPLPAGAAADPKAELRSVGCLAASSCVAVGSYADRSGNSQGLLVTGHGSTLTADTAPLPPGAAPQQGSPGAQVTAVVCPSAGVCVVIGSYTDTTGDARMLLLTGYGSAWKPVQTPVPHNAMTVGSQAQGPLGRPLLESLTCPGLAACVSVGSYPVRMLGMAGLLVTGPG